MLEVVTDDNTFPMRLSTVFFRRALTSSKYCLIALRPFSCVHNCWFVFTSQNKDSNCKHKSEGLTKTWSPSIQSSRSHPFHLMRNSPSPSGISFWKKCWFCRRQIKKLKLSSEVLKKKFQKLKMRPGTHFVIDYVGVLVAKIDYLLNIS